MHAYRYANVHHETPPGYALLTAAHVKILNELNDASTSRKKAGLNTGQFHLFITCLAAFDAAMSINMHNLAEIAATAVEQAFGISQTSPYIFYRTDEAGRVHASPLRADMRMILDHLSRAPAADYGAMENTVILAKAIAAALIACEKGAIHVARDNIGYVLKKIAQMHPPGERESKKVWTTRSLAVLQRSANSKYKVP